MECTLHGNGLLAGLEGEFIAKALQSGKIEPRFVWLAGKGKTRTNTKIYDSDSRLTTELNEPGPEITRKDEAALWRLLEGLLPKQNLLSVPAVCPGGFRRHFTVS